MSDCTGLGVTGWCLAGRHERCNHRPDGLTPRGVRVAECYVTIPNQQPGRTDTAPWVPRWPNGRDVAVVIPSHVYRCPCECHLLIGAQLELFADA